ncbi:MAG: hypothetical protein WA081_07850 [Desulfosalsimonadaceae bacterium]
MKKAFIDYVCRPYCMFYKQGQKEEMACQGLRVVKILAENRQISEESLQLGPKDRQLWAKHRRMLTAHVCDHCSFQAGDCDFQSPLFSEGMEPCGGYTVLSLLLENDLISLPMLESLS